LWENFCKAIGREDLKRFALQPAHHASVADSDAVRAKKEIQEILSQKTRDDWFNYFKHQNVCVGPVYTVEETFRDPQVQARNMVVDVEDPRYGKVRQAGIAIKLSETPGQLRRVGPAVGEHTDEVLQSLGYDARGCQELRQAGTVA
jgi:crotonobetainyl-CoA:carnitine CoA-transferase CaiB-like acyl-CoA transferase